MPNYTIQIEKCAVSSSINDVTVLIASIHTSLVPRPWLLPSPDGLATQVQKVVSVAGVGIQLLAIIQRNMSVLSSTK